MIQKIKKFVKNITVMEWAVLGIALLALVAAFAQKPGPRHGPPHKGDKASQKADESRPSAP